VRARFCHGVASGDPLPDRVVIWTRLTHDGRHALPVRWWIETMDGARAGEGTAVASAQRDWTVHVDVGGLMPATAYRYGFEAGGERSVVGRTRTLPSAGAEHLRFGQVSCAKYNAGYFNAFARLSVRDDLDFVLHLGDYIYEASNEPPSETRVTDIGRPFDPTHECVTLADYRRRYAHYRADPDVQEMHAAHPLIATLDDHELADGAWRDGGSQHDEERSGSWRSRRAAAFRARWEWLPARPPDAGDPERVFRTVSLGELADLFLIDTRSRRDQPVPPPAMDGPQRSALGPEQRAWLWDALDRSTARWRLIGNPSVMARTWSDAFDGDVKAALLKLKLIDADGTGPDYDQWDGYPHERRALLEHVARATPANVVVLSGDVHVGMANDLARDR
jgi:alkaline phosphatase D